MELLVHTISHADIVVEIARVYQDDTIESTLARPKFNQFHSLCGYIRRHVEALQSSSPGGHLAPSVTRVHARHMDDPHYAFSAICSRTEFPLGFRFSGTSLLLSELGHFSFRDSTLLAKWTAEQTSSLEKKKKDDLELENEIPLWCIQAVYFPLVGVLIPKWQSILQDHQSHHSSPLLYLLTGAGIPRDQREHAQGNSTEEIGILITLFMKHYYSTIAVQQVHSQDDLFRYDANVTFVTNQLQPHVEKQRQQLWNRVGSSWRRHFHVTLAYAGGTPARLSAVNAALRRYKPSYLHMWQLKTFWHAGKVSLDDVEFHSFDHIDASPALSIATVTNPHVHQVVTEMKAFRDQCLEALRQPHHELLSFWLRKTNQPVLSVLLVQNATDPTKVSLYRGMNCEVSMPTGSLCAERNVIGTALASDPQLHRNALRVIAVLGIEMLEIMKPISPRKFRKRPRTYSCDETSLHASSSSASSTIPSSTRRNPLAPCGACKEWLLKIAENNPSLLIVTFESMACEAVHINQLIGP